jgi:hypothetical protein
VSLKLHPDDPVDEQRNKDLSFLIFEAAKLAALVGNAKIHDLLGFLGFETLFLFVVFHVVAKVDGSALWKVHVVFEFEGEGEENGLSKR